MKQQIVLVGGDEPTKNLDEFALQTDLTDKAVKGEVEISTDAPSAADDTGTKGTMIVTDSYIYVCVDTDTWKRAELATWT